ncbi:hypothetical protein [Desulfogranum mediterraneum]|uniref:hypothetical protein n=1 Tax=Desulfogranum mediterraneum TaxID=160661 RepID=UPI00040DFA23|nr:hypothetical protein [Desulfogranum mediterraneum]
MLKPGPLLSSAIMLLSLPITTEAAVVYQDLEDLQIPSPIFRALDIDGKGSDDIAFSFDYDDWEGTTATALIPLGAPAGNGIAAQSAAALRLDQGELIDASRAYAADTTMLNAYDDWWDGLSKWGNWDNMGSGETGYLGFAFVDSGEELHYGWLQAHVNPDNQHTTIYDFAYESTPGQAIAAGDMGAPVPVPAAVYLLGSGMMALVAGRRCRR